MIKSSTITKGQVSKDLMLKNHALAKECEQRGHDIKLLMEKLVEARAELHKIKSHWLYRFINFFK